MTESRCEVATDAHEREIDFIDISEADRLVDATKTTRYPIRNALLLLMMYRHGLRVSEAINIRVSDIKVERSRMWVRRLKQGLSGEHPIAPDEMATLRLYMKERTAGSPWLFLSERGEPMTRFNVNYIVRQAAIKAGLNHIHPHMLRHGCGYYMAENDMSLRATQVYLGHRNPKNTAHYMRISGKQFEGMWA